MPTPPKTPKTVDFVRDEVTAMEPRWQLMRDSMAGQTAIKEAGTTYLPKPNAADDSAENAERFRGYKQRAIYHPITARTGKGFLGEMFKTAPQIELPAEMEALRTNADGAGMTMLQFAKLVSMTMLTTARGGLLADFPVTGGQSFTVADLVEKKVQPVLRFYRDKSITNWQTTVEGAKVVLSLVVLKEVHQQPDGFGFENVVKYRVLRKTDLGVIVEIHAIPEGQTAFAVESSAPVLDVNGKPVTDIPFWFVGSEDNHPDTISTPPLEGIAEINVGHYRNSADVEDSSFFCGQPTFVVSGMTEEWLKTTLKGKIIIGSRVGLPLPKDCTAEMIQAEPNNLPKELMADKERQMVGLGAMLIEATTVERTATEAGQEEAGKLSVISTIIHNINAAMNAALTMCARFVVNRQLKLDPATPEAPKQKPELLFEISTDLSIIRVDTAARTQLIAEWQAGAIDWEEMRSGLKEAGVAFKDDDEVRDIIEQELAAMPMPGGVPAGDPNATTKKQPGTEAQA